MLPDVLDAARKVVSIYSRGGTANGPTDGSLNIAMKHLQDEMNRYDKGRAAVETALQLKENLMEAGLSCSFKSSNLSDIITEIKRAIETRS